MALARRAFIVAGIAFLLMGFVFLLNYTSNVTGYAVFSGSDLKQSGYVALWFIASWLVIFLMAGEQRQSEDGRIVRLVRTSRFDRAVKGHDMKRIQKAIDKIGTGLGKEEKLAKTGDYSVRESGGGRVIFSYDDTRTVVTLKNYTPEHRYE